MDSLIATETTWLTGLVFVATSIIVLFVGWRLRPADRRMLERLGGVTDRASAGRPLYRDSATWRIGGVVSALDARLFPGNDVKRSRIRRRLAHAGIYSSRAVLKFVMARLAMSLVPMGVCLAYCLLDDVTWPRAIVACAVAGAGGMVVPGLWLDRRRSHRQAGYARSLPDFLDLLVACLESGLSLQAAIQRVAEELRIAHPVLSREMSIVQHEIELGSLPSMALRHFADRSGTESIRSLSTIVDQAQRFGTTLAEAFRVHAETFRVQREQRAEENAQKAAVKILFPTLLLIFPAIFVVLVGPAAVQIYQHFSRPASSIGPSAGS